MKGKKLPFDSVAIHVDQKFWSIFYQKSMLNLNLLHLRLPLQIHLPTQATNPLKNNQRQCPTQKLNQKHQTSDGKKPLRAVETARSGQPREPPFSPRARPSPRKPPAVRARKQATHPRLPPLGVAAA